MHRNTVRGAVAAAALAGAFAVAMGSASAAGLALEPYNENAAPVATTQVGEEWTSTGTSSISSGVNAKVTCLLQNTFSALGAAC
ncbi:hypothetical protein [Nocardia camponoti]|uniref:Uncharacterized protein n=1 Tax=Nocardia camponoti TaxID=1616106 RepID=A0A917QCK3_9NOCA|nr:hypothetical protein [Nocardia camponoti]GGK43080.1 hypothetical protein GCM10011591_13500 [Nocardia camponoti]